jgi:hypothetical protein
MNRPRDPQHPGHDEPEMESALKEMGRMAEAAIIPQMRKSAFVIAYADSTLAPDVWMALQIGFAVLFGKPLIVMTEENYTLPPRLAAMADEVVKVPSLKDANAKKKLKAAIDRLLEKLGK